MELLREDHAIVGRDEKGDVLAIMEFVDTKDPQVVSVVRTYVSGVLQGQGIARKLLEKMVEEMEKEGKKIHGECSYVAKQFEKNQSLYGHIDADRNHSEYLAGKY